MRPTERSSPALSAMERAFSFIAVLRSSEKNCRLVPLCLTLIRFFDIMSTPSRFSVKK